MGRTCGTASNRLAPDGQRFDAIEGLPDTRIHAFAFAPDGSVWLHRFGALEHYAANGPRFERVRQVDTAAGWPALDASAMELDAAQRLWVSTPPCLYRVDTRTASIRRYGAAVSLIDSEFIDRSLALRGDGIALAATTGGLVAFDTQATDLRLPAGATAADRGACAPRRTGARIRSGAARIAGLERP